jgi:hypothetical protein
MYFFCRFVNREYVDLARVILELGRCAPRTAWLNAGMPGRPEKDAAD